MRPHRAAATGRRAWRTVIVAQIRAGYAELTQVGKEREEVRAQMVAVLGILQEAGEVKTTSPARADRTFLVGAHRGTNRTAKGI